MNALSQNTKITASDINTLISECNGKLNLSGGTITGTLYFTDRGMITGNHSSSPNKSLEIYADIDGWSGNGAGIAMRSKDAEASDKGMVTIRAGDGTNTNYIRLSPDGVFTHNGNNVITSAGGSMNGAIYTPGYGCISSENTTSQKSLALLGFSSKHETCASINLKSVEDTDEPGFFFINAKDDTNGNKSLVGRPNGSLTWNSKEVATDNITPSAILNMSHPTYQKLCVIKASKDNAPNNGCILSYSNSEKWVGQLFVGDNATQGIYWRGCSDGTWCNWKKFFMEDENGHLYFTNGTQLWIA
jgi:hypothetical protein